MTTEQIDYIKGALDVPRDIVVTKYDSYEPNESFEYETEESIVVNLYSNEVLLASAVFDADTLRPEYDIWDYSKHLWVLQLWSINVRMNGQRQILYI